MLKEKKKILYCVGIILFILSCVLLIRFFPYIKTARILKEAKKADKITYDVSVHFDRDSLWEKEENFLKLLGQLLAVDEENLLNLRFSGEACEEYATGEIYCQAFDDPITEVYYSRDRKTINVKMLYDAISKNLSDDLWILKILLPQWQFEKDEITFEELEQTFGVDVETLIPIKKPEDIDDPSMMEMICFLSETDVEKDGEGNDWFKVDYEGYQILFSATRKDGTAEIQIEGSTESNDKKIGKFEAQLNFY